jgi:hypothetical protein
MIGGAESHGGKLMSRKLAVLLIAVIGVLTLLVPLTSSAKIPPACFEKTAGRVHVQVGYCP